MSYPRRSRIVLHNMRTVGQQFQEENDDRKRRDALNPRLWRPACCRLRRAPDCGRALRATGARLCRAPGRARSQRCRPPSRQASRPTAVSRVHPARPGMKVLDMGAGGGYSHRTDGARGGAERRRLWAKSGRPAREGQGRFRRAHEDAGDEKRRRRCRGRSTIRCRRACTISI